MEVLDDTIKEAIHEIDRDPKNNDWVAMVPIEERGGEVLQNVNEVFNLMAMRIDDDVKARDINGEKFMMKKS